MECRHRHDGRTAFIHAEADRLGVADTGDNQQPVARAAASKQIGTVEHFITIACDGDHANRPDIQAEVLGQCETQIASLAVAYLAAIKMVESTYQGLGLEVPTWCGVNLVLGVAEVVAVTEAVSVATTAVSASVEPRRRGPGRRSRPVNPDVPLGLLDSSDEQQEELPPQEPTSHEQPAGAEPEPIDEPV